MFVYFISLYLILLQTILLIYKNCRITQNCYVCILLYMFIQNIEYVHYNQSIGLVFIYDMRFDASRNWHTELEIIYYHDMVTIE